MPSSKTSILIIDDNQDDRVFYRRVLKSVFGEDVVFFEAASGESGIKEIQEKSPDCVLLDYSLPGRNGLEVLKRIRSQAPYLPVIVLTGQGSEGTAVEIMKEGAQDYITKSDVKGEVLYRVITIAIENCQMSQRIAEQQKALALFTQALAHDLCEPVKTIQAFIEMIMDEETSREKLEQYCETVAGIAKSMDGLIKSVRSYTDLVSGRQSLVKEKYNANDIVSEALENLKDLACGVEIEVRKLPMVSAHSHSLLQLFQNLIENALKHNGSEKPCVQIGAEDLGTEIRFFIHDNGDGVEEKFQKYIFEPFKRLDHNKEKSSGLGLAICKKIIELHEGNIWCESDKIGGVSFYFTLPKVAEEVGLEKKENQVTPISEGKNRAANVLWVDDSEDILISAEFYLKKKLKTKVNLFNAENGEVAIQFLKDETKPKIDLIFLDINMPKMNGFEFLKYRIENELGTDIPVVMCSTSDYEDDISQSKDLGVQGYIKKPVDAEKIRQAIHSIKGLCLKEIGDGYELLAG